MNNYLFCVEVKDCNERDVVIDSLQALGLQSAGRLSFLGHYPHFYETDIKKTFTDLSTPSDLTEFPLISLDDLTDLVIFHRNDINDANCTYQPSGTSEILQGYLSTNGWYYLFTGGIWQKHVSEHHEAAKRFQPKLLPLIEHTIKVKGLEDLIEGPVALQAALNGQTVQLSVEPWEEKHWDDFIPGVDATSTKVFFTSFHGEQKIFFRMKPKTISINGIDVPAPMNQTLKEGVEFFYLDDSNPDGYSTGVHDNSYSNKFKYGWWDSEEKIKLVAAALRKVFEVQP